MTRPPDRLPQSARDQQLRTAITRGDASSSPGHTGFARQAPRDPAAAIRAYAPSSKQGFDRLSAFATVPFASLTGSTFDITTWGGTFGGSGTAVQLNTPDDGGIYLFTAGVYAITASVAGAGIEGAAVACAIALVINSGDIPITPAAQLRGGDGATGVTVPASASATFYSAGTGLSGGLFAGLAYQHLDPAVTQVSVQVDLLLVAAAG